MATNCSSNIVTAAAGKVLQGAGLGVQNAFSTATYPSIATGTGKILRADGTNWSATTATYPDTSGTAGKVLISDGTNIVSSTPTYPNAASTALKHIKSDGTNFVTTTVTYPDASVTAGKVIISDGTNYIASTPTFPNASATSGKFIRSDGTNWIASTPTLPTSAGSAGKILYSDATNYVESVPTFPTTASATSRKIIVSDGTNFVASTETWATPSTSGNVLTSDGTNWTSATPAAGGNGFPTLSNALSNVNIVDDFIGGLTSVVQWSNSGSGQFNNNSPLSNTNPGVVSNTSFTSSSAFIKSPNSSFVLGNGVFQINWIVNPVTLSTITNTYTLKVGMADSFTSPTNAIFFSYTNATNAGQWVLNTVSASSTTSTNTTVAVTSAWHDLQIVVNAAASSVTFTIDGVAQTPIITNIPSSVSTMLFGVAGVWSAGTIAANSIAIDLFYFNYALTTPRT